MREEEYGEERKGQEEQRGESFVLFAAVCNLLNFIQCPVHSNITSHSTSLRRIHHFLGALWQESSSRNYQRFLSDSPVPLSTRPSLGKTYSCNPLAHTNNFETYFIY